MIHKQNHFVQITKINHLQELRIMHAVHVGTLRLDSIKSINFRNKSSHSHY